MTFCIAFASAAGGHIPQRRYFRTLIASFDAGFAYRLAQLAARVVSRRMPCCTHDTTATHTPRTKDSQAYPFPQPHLPESLTSSSGLQDELRKCPISRDLLNMRNHELSILLLPLSSVGRDKLTCLVCVHHRKRYIPQVKHHSLHQDNLKR